MNQSVFGAIGSGLRESTGTDAFYQHPPSFADFVMSKSFLGQPPLFRRQQYAIETPLGVDPATYFSAEKLISTIILCYGKGSGKDLLTSYLISYLTYLLLQMRDMRAYLDMAPGEPIDIITVASSQKQSSNILFSKINNWISKPLFRDFTPSLNTSDILFPKGVRLYAFHSKADTYEGYSPLVWAMQEASAFRDVQNKSNAQKVFRTLQTSARSRFKNRFIGLVSSFPRYENDFTLRLAEEAKHRDDWWSDIAASWEVRDDRTIDDYAIDLQRDSEYAMCVYGCNPSRGYGYWFHDRDALTEAFNSGLEPEVIWQECTTERVVASGAAIEYVGVDIINCNPRPDVTYIMHGDPGWKDDSFSLTIGCLSGEEDVNLGLRGVDIVAIIKWKPDRKNHRAVDFLNVAEAIKILHKQFHFYRVTFDQFNSAMLIQSLVEANVPAEDLTFSGQMQLTMYRDARMLVNNRLLHIIFDEDALREAEELLKTRSRPDHPEEGSKDIMDGIVSVAHQLGKFGFVSQPISDEYDMNMFFGTTQQYSVFVEEEHE